MTPQQTGRAGRAKRPRALRRLAAPALASLAIAAGLLLPASSQAKIDLVTLPGRDRTQVTIYKSEDLTLVRETRRLTFREGANEIQFSWAGTLIDPTSLQMRFVNPSPSFTVLDASYPANTQNTIVWNIDAAAPGEADVEITYFASGLSWRANYTARANDDESLMRIEPKFTITNASGEDYVNAQTRLVVGEVNLVELIRDLAQRGLIDSRLKDDDGARRQLGRAVMNEMAMDAAMAPAPAAAGAFFEAEEAKEIVKAAVSEYYLYTIAGTETLTDQWSKQLPNPAAVDVPFDLSYEYNPNKYGNQVVKFYKLKNDEEHELGDVPMPEGAWHVYSDDGRGSLRFQGVTTHKYTPIGEDIELSLGSDGMVILEERPMALRRLNFERDKDGNVIGHDTEARVEIEIRNSHKRPVPFKLTRPMGMQDWEITQSGAPHKKVDRSTVEWELEVPAQGKLVVPFTVVTRLGSRSTTN